MLTWKFQNFRKFRPSNQNLDQFIYLKIEKSLIWAAKNQNLDFWLKFRLFSMFI